MADPFLFFYLAKQIKNAAFDDVMAIAGPLKFIDTEHSSKYLLWAQTIMDLPFPPSWGGGCLLMSDWAYNTPAKNGTHTLFYAVVRTVEE